MVHLKSFLTGQVSSHLLGHDNILVPIMSGVSVWKIFCVVTRWCHDHGATPQLRSAIVCHHHHVSGNILEKCQRQSGNITVITVNGLMWPKSFVLSDYEQ